jgi:hypothetical protein
MTDKTDTPTEQPQIPAFTPEDLAAAVGLIDEGVNQGAYKGWEAVQTAANVRQRLMLFAQHWQNTINSASEEALKAAAPVSAPASEESN